MPGTDGYVRLSWLQMHQLKRWLVQVVEAADHIRTVRNSALYDDETATRETVEEALFELELACVAGPIHAVTLTKGLAAEAKRNGWPKPGTELETGQQEYDALVQGIADFWQRGQDPCADGHSPTMTGERLWCRRCNHDL